MDVDQLKREANIKRIPISQAVEDLKVILKFHHLPEFQIFKKKRKEMTTNILLNHNIAVLHGSYDARPSDYWLCQ